jgi:hypothetical protein
MTVAVNPTSSGAAQRYSGVKAVESRWTRESRNTQSLGLRFCALLTEDGYGSVRLHSV